MALSELRIKVLKSIIVSSHLKKLENEKQSKPKASRKKEIEQKSMELNTEKQ